MDRNSQTCGDPSDSPNRGKRSLTQTGAPGRIMGHGDLWVLKATLDEPQQDQHLAEAMKAS